MLVLSCKWCKFCKEKSVLFRQKRRLQKKHQTKENYTEKYLYKHTDIKLMMINMAPRQAAFINSFPAPMDERKQKKASLKNAGGHFVRERKGL